MAFDRHSWMRHTRNRLCSALGEYAKVKFAELIDFPFDWKPEVAVLMDKVADMFDPQKTKVKGKFDLKKMFKEVLVEVSGEQVQITQAKNNFIHDYIKERNKKLEFLHNTRAKDFDANTILFEMLEQFSPDLLKLIH